MDRRHYAEVLRAHAKLTWSLSEKARDEGNLDLADELYQLAAETEMRAMSTWPVHLRGEEAEGTVIAEDAKEGVDNAVSAPAELKPIPLRKKKTEPLDAR